MKILLDTNILISAFIFGGSVKNLLNILLGTEYVLYISEYVDNEFILSPTQMVEFLQATKQIGGNGLL